MDENQVILMVDELMYDVRVDGSTRVNMSKLMEGELKQFLQGCFKRWPDVDSKRFEVWQDFTK